MNIRQFRCLEDNYGFLVNDPETAATWCIDTPDAEVIQQALEEAGWRLTGILNTHHHDDHIGGNLALKSRWDCPVYGPAAHAGKIPGIDHPVNDGDVIGEGRNKITVLNMPGHTRGHIGFWFQAAQLLFPGDTLFPLGCGRLFGGTIEQLYDSLQRLAALPGATLVYSAHEYTEKNLDFALSLDAESPALQARGDIILRQLAQGEPTVPTTILAECQTNPFLNTASPRWPDLLQLPGANPVEILAELRTRRDHFTA